MSELKGPLLVERSYCGEWVPWMVEHDLGGGTLEWWQGKCDGGDYRLREFTPGKVVWPEVVTYTVEYRNTKNGITADEWRDSDRPGLDLPRAEDVFRFGVEVFPENPRRIIDSTGEVVCEYEPPKVEPVTYRWEYVNTDGEWDLHRDFGTDKPSNGYIDDVVRVVCCNRGVDQRVIDSTGKVHAHFRRVTETVTRVEEVPVD